ncbi:MAG: NTP transferase domain-containing protein [Chitinispirillales bacterium]|jgi:mannose-1-phosphate guanylyltransferase|nr:NTP transferase domain-containing protein [Chitinispirillales bacterium]
MRGLVLSAGFGSRLKPITDIIPKALAPVCGIPLFEIALRRLRKNAVYDLAVNIHYMSEFMDMALDNLPYYVKRFYEKPQILGTGGALWNAKDWFFEDNVFCVTNADIIHNVKIKKLSLDFKSSGTDIALICSNVCGEKVMGIGKNNEYVGRVDNLFGEMQRSSAFTGIAFYRSAVAEIFRKDDFDVKTIWKRAVECGFSVQVWDFNDILWFDTGTVNDLKNCYWAILDKKIPFSFPLGMKVDFEKKIAYPSSKNYEISKDSRYLWIENVLAEKIDASYSIFWGGSKIENKKYKNTIVTPWGEI